MSKDALTILQELFPVPPFNYEGICRLARILEAPKEPTFGGSVGYLLEQGRKRDEQREQQIAGTQSVS